MLTPPRPRITTPAQAERCLQALAAYFRRHESPLAAEDLLDAVEILRRQGTKGRRPLDKRPYGR